MTLLRRLLKRRIGDESGATMVVIAGGFLALVATAAFVVDLGVVRKHRSEARLVVDAAATAGSLDVGEGDGQGGCATAVEYVELNLGVSFPGINCTGLSGNCTNTQSPAKTTDTADGWELTVTYPIPDGHALMTSSVVGANPQSIVYSDGTQCERLGVELKKTDDTFFGRVLGQDQSVTYVHAVAVTRAAQDATVAVNLVILERYDCDALAIEGSGGGTGGIYVDVVVGPGGEIIPGFATVDADGTGDDCGSDGVLDVDGSNAIIRADGPEGCDDQTDTHVGPGGVLVGESCGKISVLAPGTDTPGCNPPACTSSGTVSPDPSALGRRVTRAPIDYRYNCKASYPFPAGWEIRGCPDPSDPHIDNLVGALGGSGAPPGYQTWTALGHPCTVAGPSGTTIAVDGDVYVDCATFSVKRNVHLTGGNVVFAGNVIVEGSGFLSINGEPGGDPMSPGLSAVEVFVRGGLVRKAGGTDFVSHNSMWYLSSSSELQLEGGTGVLVWTSPNDGDFAHLAMWSESAIDHSLAGNSFLDLEGIFFAPLAKLIYSGNGVQHQVEAQFVSRKLNVVGQGLLIISPRFDAVVKIPESIIALIR